MADLFCIAQTAEVALSAASAKTVVSIKAPANHRLKVLRWGIFFDGISSVAEPVQVRLLRQSTDGTSTSATIVKIGTDSETIQSTGGYNFTAEPTAGDVLDVAEVHPQAGYEVIFPTGQEIKVAGGGRIGIECTAPATVNCRAKIVFEE
jgi:hypothetical protein